MDQHKMVLRQVPVRRPVACETCMDIRAVHRIIGGTKWLEPCPDCSGGAW
jgi:hypothetical protein